MDTREQLFYDRERKRLERHDLWERITENGTISAAVMVLAAVAAVICANSNAYEAVHHFLEQPIYIGLGSWTARSCSSTTFSWRFSSCSWGSSLSTR